MKVKLQGDRVHYTSIRTHKRAAPAYFSASYQSTGPIYRAAPGTMDHWLTERYCLYSALTPDCVVYGEIHHPQWQLQPATVELRGNTMAEAVGITLSKDHAVCHFSRYQEVVAWPIVPLEHAKPMFDRGPQ
jgi:hypothetical protein